LYNSTHKLEWAQAMIAADGLRHAPGLPVSVLTALWILALLVGAMVMLPSQMSIVDDFSRRWTDAVWTANRTVRETMRPDQVNVIYYVILGGYVLWSFVCAYFFNTYGTPKLMTLVIANLNNVSIGATSFVLLWMNLKLLPQPVRPRWYHSLG